MGKFDGFLFCTDLDNTLTLGTEVSSENCEAIKYFQQEGGLFTLATGRHPNHLKMFYDRFRPNTYLVALNGAVIYDLEKEQIVSEHKLDTQSVELAEQVFRDKAVCRITYHYPNRSLYILDTEKERIYEQDYSNCYKFVFETKEESEILKLKDKILPAYRHRYNMSRSWRVGMEVCSLESRKDFGVKKIRAMHGDKIHTVVCAGDFENDIEMLEYADISYAVANATSSAKAAADRITVGCTEHAIARIISELA